MARAPSEASSRREIRRRMKFLPVSEDVFRREAPAPLRKRRRTQHRLLEQAAVFTPQEDSSGLLSDTISRRDGEQPGDGKHKLYGSRQRLVVLALVRLNEDQTGFEFRGYTDKRFVMEAYQDKVKDAEGKTLDKKVESNRGNAFLTRNSFIKTLESLDGQQPAVKRRTLAVIGEIRNMYPSYKDLTIPQIIGILDRTLDFTEIVQPVTMIERSIWKQVISDPTPPNVPEFLRHLREANAHPMADGYLGTPVRNSHNGWGPISDQPLNNRK
ncbi:MAG: hypothetical protein HY344_01150 [Candidatus Levybacteria bacterium]|nr:hypothetical protein [Candidatus Levybacteria bacterium]